MEQPLISVIVPIYNVEPYLQQCLDSLFNNTYRNLEIICVNDGSPDNCLAILERQTDPRLHIFSQENGGISSARNKGLECASGEYIAFVDSDDWVSEFYFETLMSVALEKKCDIVICGYFKTESYLPDAPRESLKKGAEPFPMVDLFNNSYYKGYVWGRLYRRELVEHLRFDEAAIFAEDIVYNIKVLCTNENISVYFTDNKLYYYLIRSNSAVRMNDHVTTKKIVEEVYIPNYERFQYRKDFLLEQICRTLLATRYLEMFKHDASLKPYYAEKFRFVFARLNSLSLKKRLLYRLLIRFPLIYRAYRIATDPTMIAWEKQQRKKYKQSAD